MKIDIRPDGSDVTEPCWPIWSNPNADLLGEVSRRERAYTAGRSVACYELETEIVGTADLDWRIRHHRARQIIAKDTDDWYGWSFHAGMIDVLEGAQAG